jgi:polar amino acid transport system substrate-binding protein
MKALGAAAALLLSACAAAPTVPLAEVAPQGSLRVAVAVGPSPSAFWATRDPASGRARGVTVDLGGAAAANLGVPVKIVEYSNSGEITAAASKGEWDLSFMPQDVEREKYVDTGPGYVVYSTTYAVHAASGIAHIAAIDRHTVRVGAVEGTSTSRILMRTLKHAKLVLFPKAGEAQAQFDAQRLDALAMGREALDDYAANHPGTQVLPENIQTTAVIVVVPKSRPATKAWAARFIEEAKRDGTVRRALDHAGFTSAALAPPAKPSARRRRKSMREAMPSAARP